MNKTAYILVGIAAVLLGAFLAASHFYPRADKAALPKPTASGASPNAALLTPADSASLGSMMARVTVVEFLDPECEGCRAMHPIVKRIMREFDGRVRLLIRYMPLHRNSVYAASALEAAGEQGRYWDMLDVLFQHQPEWASHEAPKPELIPQLAARIGLDMKAFEKSIINPAHKLKIQRDQEAGKAFGVTGTPSFFVNGRLLEQLGYEPLKALIERELLKN
jgi:protein-disulfide isomerase